MRREHVGTARRAACAPAARRDPRSAAIVRPVARATCRSTRSPRARAPSPASGSASRRFRASPLRTDGRWSAFRRSRRSRTPFAPRPRSRMPLVAAWMDAARGEVFTSLFAARRREPAALRASRRPAVGSRRRRSRDGRRSRSTRGVLFAGDGAVRYHDAIASGARRPRPASSRRCPCWRASLRSSPTPPRPRGLAARRMRCVPLYVRRPDAELARDRAHAAPSPGC